MVKPALRSCLERSRIWVTRYARPLLVFVLASGTLLALAQTAGSTDAQKAMDAQTAFDLNPSVGGPRSAGTAALPTAVGSLKPSHSVTDFSLADGLGGFTFSHTFSASLAAWAPTLDDKIYAQYHFGSPTIPPFGSAAANPKTQHYSHSLSSYVQTWVDKNEYSGVCTNKTWENDTCTPEGSAWILRTPSGGSFTFPPCTGNRQVDPEGRAACITDTGGTSFPPNERLAWDGQGFVYYTPQARYYYRQRVGEGLPTYYLSWIEDAQYGASEAGRRKTIELSYGVPAGCQGANLGHSLPAYPLSATTFNGTRLYFYYRPVESPRINEEWSGATQECVLVRVSLSDTDSGSVDAGVGLVVAPSSHLVLPVQSTDLVVYHQSIIGAVSCVHHPLTGEDYNYDGPGESTWSAKKGERLLASKSFANKLDGGWSGPYDDFWTTQETGEDQSFSVLKRVEDREDDPQNTSEFAQYFTTTQVSAGDGSGATASLRNRYFLVYEPDGESFVRGSVSDCTGTGACGSGQGMSRWRYQTLQSYRVPLAEQSKGGAWTSYRFSDSGTAGLNLRKAPALTQVLYGASAQDGAGAVLTVNRSYDYLGKPSTEPVTTAEQVVRTVSLPSIVAGASDMVSRRVTDLATKRVKATFVKGTTRTLNSASGSAGNLTRTIGTFYNVSLPGGTPDPFGRTLEQVGPCEVSYVDATTAETGLPTTCKPPPSGEAPVPVVRYEYYGDTQDGTRRRLYKQVRYPQAALKATGELVLGQGLTTTYEAYDAWGNATRVRDENNVLTVSTYSGTRLLKTAVFKPGFESDESQATVTRYEYEGEYLRRMQKPDGDWEVYCYRAGADTSCTGGTPTSHLQWKATAPADSPNATTWFEKTAYTYRFGQLSGETVYDSTNRVRREVRYDSDPLGRQTFQQVGTTAGDLVTHKRFYASGLLLASGQPYNRTSPLCAGGDDARCHKWEYDAMGRLTRLLEPTGWLNTPAGDFIAAAASCLRYDARGNLTAVWRREGACDTSATPDVSFEYDDFGKVLSVKALWLGQATPSAPGLVRFEYDAQGNLTKKQTPAMAAAGGQSMTFSYDAAGRMTAARTFNSTGPIELYNLYYDTSFPLTLCGGSYPDLTANTLGRLQVREDSFGYTFYSYDHGGRVTKQVRRRKAVGCVPTNPARDYLVSTFEYDKAGRLLNETYPHGRKLVYGYHNASDSARTAPSSRVKSISLLKYVSESKDGDPVTLLSDIQWEPYGKVRSYRVNAPLAASGQQEALVEYLPGNNAAPLRTCADGRTDSSNDGTGRLAGLWVSRGEDTAASGDIFKRSFLWQGDQLTEQATCLLRSSGSPQIERFGYDMALRLTSATRASGNFGTTGGAWGKRNYALSATGARQKDTHDCWEFTNTNEGSTDRLVSRTATASQCAAACRAYGFSSQYSYDLDGRASAKTLTDGQGGQAATSLTFDSALDGNAAVGAVFRSITMKRGAGAASTYTYYYDSFGRRRLKQYPVNSLSDEYFYDGDKLLEDQGNNRLDPPGANFVLDEYVWLDGKPVALLKSSITRGTKKMPDNTTVEVWTRASDDSVAGNATACARNGEDAPCGTYFIVTDYLGKPVLMLNAKRQVTGTGDYDPFGHVNRVTYLGQARAQDARTRVATFGYFTQPPLSASEAVHLRARYANVDTDALSTDYVYLTTKSGTEAAPGLTLAGTATASNAKVGGAGLGAQTTAWLELPPFGDASGGAVHVRFRSDGAADAARLGVTLEGYEYRRFQYVAKSATDKTNAVAWVWTPLRFPGQYHDAETDLFENWNRYYDPSVGRYLGPEPMYRDPKWLLAQFDAGVSPAAYSYAKANPIVFADPDGLDVAVGDDEKLKRFKKEAMDKKSEIGKSKAGATLRELDKSTAKVELKKGDIDADPSLRRHGGAQTSMVWKDGKLASAVVSVDTDYIGSAQFNEDWRRFNRTEPLTLDQALAHEFGHLQGATEPEGTPPPGNLQDPKAKQYRNGRAIEFERNLGASPRSHP